jgi:hypothetical protein
MHKSKLDPLLVGDIADAALPFDDPTAYGHVDVLAEDAFEARSLQVWQIVYTAGHGGLDDTGGLKIVFRHTVDWGGLQAEDPTAHNFVSAQTSNGVSLEVAYDPFGQGARSSSAIPNSSKLVPSRWARS